MPLIKTESRLFIFLVGLAAVSVAMWAAIFSVTGLSMLYSGSMFYVASAMAILEFSKIIVASYLYRQWKSSHWLLKTYLTGALVVLMIITSGGIYGYLSNSYQGVTVGLDKINSQAQVLDQRKLNLSADRERIADDIAILRAERQSTIENRNEEIAANNLANDSSSVKYRAWRNSQVFKRYNEELTRIDNNISQYTENLDSTNVRLSKISSDISDKKIEMIDTGVEIGPLVYMSRIFNTTMDNIMKWFTLVIVLVFDPLAIALILALNVIIVNRKSKKVLSIDSEPIPEEIDYNLIGDEEEFGPVDLNKEEPDDLSFLKLAKPIEQAFDDIEKKIDEHKKSTRPRFSEPNKPNKTAITTDFVSQEAFQSYDFSPRPDIELDMDDDEEIDIDLDDVIKEEYKKEVNDNSEINDDSEISDPEAVYNKEITSLTDEEIKNAFEDASREVRANQIGRVSRVEYESGGMVKVDHSIQE